MRKTPIQALILTALFAALLAVLSQLAIPSPSGVPITLQTFAVALCGFTLGTKRGTLSVAVYLLLGAIGLPVFSGFLGGIGVFVGVTGGFLWGFLGMAALCGTRRVVPAALGLIACHLPGVLWFALASHTAIIPSFLIASAPFLLKDAFSIAVAWLASQAVRRGLAAARLSLP